MQTFARLLNDIGTFVPFEHNDGVREYREP